MMNTANKMHPEDRANLILFTVTALVVYLAYTHFFVAPQMAAMKAQEQRTALLLDAPSLNDPTALKTPRAQALAAGQRVAFGNAAVAGSIPLTGGRIDDLQLLDYPATLAPNSPKVSLLSPAGTDYPLYAEFGYVRRSGQSVSPAGGRKPSGAMRRRRAVGRGADRSPCPGITARA